MLQRYKKIFLFATVSAILISVCSLMGAACSAPKANTERAEIEIVCLNETYRYEDKLIQPTNHTVAETISRRKINAALEEKLRMVDRCLAAGAQWREAVRYSFPLLPQFVQKIVGDAALDAKDSVITFRPDGHPMFSITREQVGRKVDETRVYREIYIALHRNAHAKLKLTPEPVRPLVTVLDNIKLTNLRSRFSTDYSASNENRKHNIRLALSKINGTVLKPQEEFSFNTVVGRRTESNGFKEAKIIVSGEYKEGFGGGVCQASTTVYNAALRADMLITRARNHSLLPAYVAPSFDAMVNSGSSDMCFKNTGATPVFIRTHCDDSKLCVEFYGSVLPYKISTESREISRGEVPEDREIVDLDRKYVLPDTPHGERVRVSYSHASLQSEGYIVYKDASGRIIDRKKLRSDTYSKSVGIIAVAP